MLKMKGETDKRVFENLRLSNFHFRSNLANSGGENGFYLLKIIVK